MNMNNFPRGFEHATERNPIPLASLARRRAGLRRLRAT